MRNYSFLNHITNSLHVVEPKGSLFYSQDGATNTSLSQMHQVLAIPSSLIKILLNIIVLCAPCSSFDLFTKTVCAPLISPMHATFPAYLSLIFGSNICLLVIWIHLAVVIQRLASLYFSNTAESESWEADSYLYGAIHQAAGRHPVATEDQVQSHSGLCGIF